MTAKKKSAGTSTKKKAAKTTAKKATTRKKAAAKKAAPKKKAAAKKSGASEKSAAAKKRATPKKKAAATRTDADKKTQASDATSSAKTAPKKASRGGSVCSSDINLGHVFALRPRANSSFRPNDFMAAKRALRDEKYGSVAEAARAVAEEALSLTRGDKVKIDPKARR